MRRQNSKCRPLLQLVIANNLEFAAQLVVHRYSGSIHKQGSLQGVRAGIPLRCNGSDTDQKFWPNGNPAPAERAESRSNEVSGFHLTARTIPTQPAAFAFGAQPCRKVVINERSDTIHQTPAASATKGRRTLTVVIRIELGDFRACSERALSRVGGLSALRHQRRRYKEYHSE